MCSRMPCGNCLSCISNQTSTEPTLQACILCMCSNLTPDKKCLPFPPLDKYLARPKNAEFYFVEGGGDACLASLNVSLRIAHDGKTFDSLDGAFGRKPGLCRAFFLKVLGCAPTRDHEFVGKPVYHLWINDKGQQQALLGTITACLERKSERLFDVKYHTEDRRRQCWKEGEPQSIGRITERVARGAIQSYKNYNDNELGQRQTNIASSHSGQQWLVPSKRIFTPEPCSSIPRLDVFFGDFAITFRVRDSGIPGAGLGLWRSCREVNGTGAEFFELPAGSLLDLGIYAPLVSEDVKEWHVLMMKHLVHGWKAEGWTWETPYGSKNTVYDVTDDFDGELTSVAKKNVLVYVSIG